MQGPLFALAAHVRALLDQRVAIAGLVADLRLFVVVVVLRVLRVLRVRFFEAEHSFSIVNVLGLRLWVIVHVAAWNAYSSAFPKKNNRCASALGV